MSLEEELTRLSTGSTMSSDADPFGRAAAVIDPDGMGPQSISTELIAAE